MSVRVSELALARQPAELARLVREVFNDRRAERVSGVLKTVSN